METSEAEAKRNPDPMMPVCNLAIMLWWGAMLGAAHLGQPKSFITMDGNCDFTQPSHLNLLLAAATTMGTPWKKQREQEKALCDDYIPQP